MNYSALSMLMAFNFTIGIFYPSGAEPTGPPISPQCHRCSSGRLDRFGIAHDIFMSHCLNLFERLGWVGGGGNGAHLEIIQISSGVNK